MAIFPADDSHEKRLEAAWTKHMASSIRKDYKDIPDDATDDEILIANAQQLREETGDDLSPDEYKSALDDEYGMTFKGPEKTLGEKIGPVAHFLPKLPGALYEGLKTSFSSPFTAGVKTRQTLDYSGAIKNVEEAISSLEKVQKDFGIDNQGQINSLRADIDQYKKEQKITGQEAVSAGAEAIASYGTLPLTGAAAVAKTVQGAAILAAKTGTTAAAKKIGAGLTGTIAKHAVTGATVAGAYGVTKGGLESAGHAAQEGKGAGEIFDATWRGAGSEGIKNAVVGTVLGGVLGTTLEKTLSPVLKRKGIELAAKQQRAMQSEALYKFTDGLTPAIFKDRFRADLSAGANLPMTDLAQLITSRILGRPVTSADDIVVSAVAQKIATYRQSTPKGLLPAYEPEIKELPLELTGEGAAAYQEPFNPETAPLSAEKMPVNPETVPPAMIPGTTEDIEYARKLYDEVIQGIRTKEQMHDALVNLYVKRGNSVDFAERRAVGLENKAADRRATMETAEAQQYLTQHPREQTTPIEIPQQDLQTTGAAGLYENPMNAQLEVPGSPTGLGPLPTMREGLPTTNTGEVIWPGEQGKYWKNPVTGELEDPKFNSASLEKVSLSDKVAQSLSKAAKQAEKRLAKKLGRMSVGFDPTMLSDLVLIGADQIYNGGQKTYKNWSSKMLELYGTKIKPYLTDLYTQAIKYLNESHGPAAISRFKQAYEMMPSIKETKNQLSQIKKYQKQYRQKIEEALIADKKTRIIPATVVRQNKGGSYWLTTSGNFVGVNVHVQAGGGTLALSKNPVNSANDAVHPVYTAMANAGLIRVQTVLDGLTINASLPLTTNQISALREATRGKKFTGAISLFNGRSIALEYDLERYLKILDDLYDME